MALTKERFLTYFNEFNQILQSETSTYNTLFGLYLNLAEKTFEETLYGDSIEYIHALYVAHNLQLAVNRNKNINNQANLNSTNISNTVSNNLGGKEVAKGSEVNYIRATYNQTRYGQELYSLVQPLVKISLIGVY
jgi:hypothetical protein